MLSSPMLSSRLSTPVPAGELAVHPFSGGATLACGAGNIALKKRGAETITGSALPVIVTPHVGTTTAGHNVYGSGLMPN